MGTQHDMGSAGGVFSLLSDVCVCALCACVNTSGKQQRVCFLYHVSQVVTSCLTATTQTTKTSPARNRAAQVATPFQVQAPTNCAQLHTVGNTHSAHMRKPAAET